MLEVEAARLRGSYEKLRAVGGVKVSDRKNGELSDLRKIPAVVATVGIRHGELTATGKDQLGAKFVNRGKSRIARTRPRLVATLNDETGDDAMKNHAVIKSTLRRTADAARGRGSDIPKKLILHVALERGGRRTRRGIARVTDMDFQDRAARAHARHDAGIAAADRKIEHVPVRIGSKERKHQRLADRNSWENPRRPVFSGQNIAKHRRRGVRSRKARKHHTERQSQRETGGNDHNRRARNRGDLRNYRQRKR